MTSDNSGRLLALIVTSDKSSRLLALVLTASSVVPLCHVGVLNTSFLMVKSLNDIECSISDLRKLKFNFGNSLLHILTCDITRITYYAHFICRSNKLSFFALVYL